jgi:hypothetical protein
MGLYEYGKDTSRSIKDGEFLDRLSDCELFTKGSVTWT